MKTETVPINPWHTHLSDAVSWAVEGVVSGVGSAVSKTVNAWMSIPKAIKLPIETSAFLYAPREWVGSKVLAGVVLLTETPKDLVAFLSNQPVKYFGERWQLVGSSFPSDPKAPLTDLNKKIGTFERSQSVLSNPIPPLPHDIPLTAAVPLQPLNDMEKITDKNLEILIEKVSYLSILKTMHAYSRVAETDSSNILCLVDEASRKYRPSLWNIFVSHYGSKMSWWGHFKARLLYLFLWKIPIIPKTVDAYLKKVLAELRINLKENGENRKKFINGLLEDADNFFEVYNGAAETYAKDKARKGNLNYYRKNAIELMLPREEFGKEETPEKLRKDLYRKLSASIVDRFSPNVRFGLFEKVLNYFIKKMLRDSILPEVFLNVSDEGKEATKRHNIPFFLALTKTLAAQISKLQGNLEEDSSDSSSLAGIGNFESIVKKFLWAIDMADCKTVEEVRLKMEQLKQPESGIEANVRNGIQLGIQKGLAVLFDYLSKQENTEELFATLFESVAYPLSGNLPMNDKQWAEIAIEYEGNKILLKQAGSTLSKQIVQKAIQDKVRGGAIPEETERLAQKIFSEHKARGLKTFEDLLQSTTEIRKKIRQSKDFFSEETSIHPELGAIASTLKAFENKERVKITMEQDPPPLISLLPHAEQEAILRVLYPLYEKANQVMDTVIHLQGLQKQLTRNTKLGRELRQMKEGIGGITSNSSPEALSMQIAEIETHFQNIKEIFPEAANKLLILREQIFLIHEMLDQIALEKKALEALAHLQSFPASQKNPGLLDQLFLCVQGNPPPGFKKWKCIEQIKENIKIASLSSVDQHRALQLIDKISKYNAIPEPRPEFKREIWGPLSALLNQHKTSLERNQKRIATFLERMMPKIYQNLSREETQMHQLSKVVWEGMNEKTFELQDNVLRLNKLIEHAKKEILLHPSAIQLGKIGGTLGFLLGFSTGVVAPEIGGVIGAVAASSVAGLGNLAKRKWLKFSLPVLGAGAVASVATSKLVKIAEAALPNMPLIPALIGAAGASAGLEYAWANVTKRLIDTGVDITMPKVTEIFDKAYEQFLMSDIVINGGLKIVIKQVVELFPPKKT